MTDNQAVDILLSVERDICNRIHDAITEILRKSYEDGGKEQIKSMVESICYKMDVVERRFDKMG